LKKIRIICIYLILSIGCLISIFPFYWSFVKAITPEGEIFKYPPDFITNNPTLENITDLVSHIHILRSLLNSFIVASAFTILTLFLCSLGGYAFAKFNFPFKKALFIFMISTMALPFVVQLIPLFIIMVKFKWVDTYQALIIPWAANGFGVFWMKQYIEGLHSDLIDAARVDGCTEFRIYFSIILPNIKPALFSLGIIQFLSNYNGFLWPLVVINKVKMYTAPLSLAMLKSSGVTQPVWGELMAGSALVVLPMIIIFLIFQRHIVRGVMGGSIKE